MFGVAFSSRIVAVSIVVMLSSMTLFCFQSAASSGGHKQVIFQDNPPYWPTDGWIYSAPEEQGMSNETLSAMMDIIEEQEYPIHSVLVVRNGYAVFERYPHEYYPASHLTLLHSVTKSFASVLIGIAIQQGLLNGVNETVLSFFPEYTVANPDPRKDAMTIENLLTMTPGFEWDEWSYPYEDSEHNNLRIMMDSPDAVQYVLDRPMSYDPGTHWAYNGGASLLLAAIIQQISNQTTLEFAEQYLFDPLGFGPPIWYTTSGGWYNSFGGLCMTTRDMAKLGFLYLNNGTWDETQILPADYISNSTEPINLVNPLGSSFGYGWHWWIRSDLGIYFAYGRYGQKIMIAPEYNLVVAFTAHILDGEYDPEFDLFRDYILVSIEDVATPASLPVLEAVVFSGMGIIVIIAVIKYRQSKS